MVRVFAAWAGEEIASGTARTIAVTTAFRDGFMALLTKESCRRRGSPGWGHGARCITEISGISGAPAPDIPCCQPGRAVLRAGRALRPRARCPAGPGRWGR